MKFGITQSFSCSYLPDEQEQLLVYAENNDFQAWRYSQLIQVGFRRSGEQIYRPHCPACKACKSVRIPVNAYTPSRSQKRLLKANQGFRVQLVSETKSTYYPLYERYITERHADGSMYPPSRTQFEWPVKDPTNAPSAVINRKLQTRRQKGDLPSEEI